MSNIEYNLHSSSLFDARLITMGSWSTENYELFTMWLDQSSIDFKRKKAGEVLIKLVDNILKEDITYDGRIRISYLYDLISSLENLVFTTRELKNKFYRDHLNHALRVAIVARVIAINEPFKLDVAELNQLIISCLFHDLAYPLIDVVKIFDATTQALKKCYFLADDYILKILTDEKKENDYLYDHVSESDSRINYLLNERNHGIYSALEFIYHLKKEEKIIKKYKDVINAIAIHDSACSSIIDIAKDKIASILIISDELQDWGRISVGGTKTVDRIERFEVKDNVISGDFPHIKDQNFSTIKQISGKMKNFRRLNIKEDALKIHINFNTSSFLRINLSDYQEVLMNLYELSENKNIINPLTNTVISDSPHYERKLYGLKLNNDIKNEVYESISKYKIISDKKYLYLNIDNNETIFSILFDAIINALPNASGSDLTFLEPTPV